MTNKSYVEKLVFLSILVSMSVVLGIIDTQLLAALTPGYRIGLANIVILTGIYYLKFHEGLILVITKSLIIGLLYGGVMTFTIGGTGTILSFLVMAFLLKVIKENVSLIGVSLAGAVTHSLGQIFVLILYYGIGMVFYLFFLMFATIATGLLVGAIVINLIKYLDQGQVFKTITAKEKDYDYILDLINRGD